MTTSVSGRTDVASLATSYRYCIQVARKSRSNFYCSFFALPHEMFRDMCVLYAYMRQTDDLGDQGQNSLDVRREQLRVWKGNLSCALQGQLPPGESLFPALLDLMQRRGVPPELLYDVITGVESDLAPRRFADSLALQRYCYHVAGVVGLACLQIWGYDGSQEARELAVECGRAFQLTNILRDVREDALNGRVYLPQDVLREFQCSEMDLIQSSAGPKVRLMVAHVLAEARQLLEHSRSLEGHLSQHGRRMYRAMHSVYGDLQAAITNMDHDVLGQRAQVSTLRTLRTALRCVWDRWLGR